MTYVFKYVFQIQHVWTSWKYEYNETQGLFLKNEARKEKGWGQKVKNEKI